MRYIRFYMFSLLLATMSSSWAAGLEKPITLEEASRAAGLNTGSQQRISRQGINLQQLALGMEQAYSAKPDEARLQLARNGVSLFSAPVAKPKAGQAVDSQALLQPSLDLGIIIAIENQEQLKILDIPAFMAGFKAGYTNKISSEKLAAASLVVSQFSQQQRMLGAEERLVKAKIFLAENAKRKGVIVTKSGLQYEIITQGTGATPTEMDMVNVNYRHSKPDSDFLYDSAEHNHSETMPLRGTMPLGWHELFLLMNKGSRYRVYLSPALGFGSEGNGDALLPNEVLITEFTLLDIIPPPAVAY